MNRKLITIVLSCGAIMFAGGYLLRGIQPVAGWRHIESAEALDPAMRAQLCPITNQENKELKVTVIASELSGGTSFIQPKSRGLFYCGDRVELAYGSDKFSMVLTKTVSFSLEGFMKAKGKFI